MRKLRQKAVEDLAQGHTACQIEPFTEKHITCSSASQITDDTSQKEMKVEYEELLLFVFIHIQSKTFQEPQPEIFGFLRTLMLF